MAMMGSQYEIHGAVGVQQELLPRNSQMRASGEPAGEVEDLFCSRFDGKARRKLPIPNRIAEAPFDQCDGARGATAQERVNGVVVYQWRDADEETTPGRPFLGRALDGVTKKTAKRFPHVGRGQQSFGRERALLLRVASQAAHEERFLVAEDCVEAGSSNTHSVDEIVDCGAVITLRPKDLHGALERFVFLEVPRPPAGAFRFTNHLVGNRLIVGHDYRTE